MLLFFLGRSDGHEPPSLCESEWIGMSSDTNQPWISDWWLQINEHQQKWEVHAISSMESSLCPINQCPRTWVGNHHCNDGNRKLGLRPSVPKWDRVFGQKHLPNHHLWCIINVSMYHPNISGSVPDFEVVVVPHRTWVDQVLVLGQIWPMRFRLRIKEDNAAKKNGSGERTSINFSHWGSPSHRFHY